MNGVERDGMNRPVTNLPYQFFLSFVIETATTAPPIAMIIIPVEKYIALITAFASLETIANPASISK